MCNEPDTLDVLVVMFSTHQHAPLTNGHNIQGSTPLGEGGEENDRKPMVHDVRLMDCKEITDRTEEL